MENWIYYILIGVIIINAWALVKKYFGENILEGLDNDNRITPTPLKKTPDLITGHTEDINLNLGNNRGDYEKTILHMDKHIGSSMTKLLGQHASLIAKDPESQEAQKKMQSITTMSKFRGALNDTMKWMDGTN